MVVGTRTPIDFDGNRAALSEYLRNQRTLRDYDYESSAIGTLLNVLSFNQNVGGIHANFVSNEAYLGSATQRKNVVSKAADLGYTPRFAHGATATLCVRVSNTNSREVTTDPNLNFLATVDGRNINFVLPERLTIAGNSTNDRIVNIVQGTYLTHAFVVGETMGTVQVDRIDDERYVLPNPLVDGRSLIVTEEDGAGEEVGVYTLADDITEVMKTDRVFFIKENENELVEVYFSDPTVSMVPTSGNTIRVGYRTTLGEAGNGIRVFEPPAFTNGITMTIMTADSASGGDNGENVSAIKRNAPRVRRSRKRLVVPEDYESAISEAFGDIRDIRVWKGRDNVPPTPGAVFISIQTESTDFLSAARQDEIERYLERRSIIDMNHVFVRPEHLFVVPTITVRYDPRLTSTSPADLASGIANEVIIPFERDNLREFGTSFLHSSFTNAITGYGNGITDVIVDVTMQRRLRPRLGIRNYSVNYNNPIYHPQDGYVSATDSTPFAFRDEQGARIDDNGLGRLRIYRRDGEDRVILNGNVGTVSYPRGILNITNLSGPVGEEIRLNVRAAAVNVHGIRNQVLFITNTDISVIDVTTGRTVATLGGVETDGENLFTDDDFQDVTIL